MASLMEVLESTGLEAQRGVYSGQEKPEAYITFLRISRNSALDADDAPEGSRELWRVSLFCRGDFEEKLEALLGAMKDAGYYINGVMTEIYENDTRYWQVPINIEILKED